MKSEEWESGRESLSCGRHVLKVRKPLRMRRLQTGQKRVNRRRVRRFFGMKGWLTGA